MTHAVVSPMAKRDLTAAARWIAKDNPKAARELRHAIANAAERLGRHPHFGRAQPNLLPSPYRFVTVSGFPYVIIYNADRAPPLIVRILHTSRNLGPLLRDFQ